MATGRRAIERPVHFGSQCSAQPTAPFDDRLGRSLGPNRSILPSYSVAKYGQQQQTDPFLLDAGNGVLKNGTPISNNDPNDAYVPLVPFRKPGFRTWSPSSARRPAEASVFWLDNEPSIWFQPTATSKTGPTGDVFNDMIAYGSMIKSGPTAQVQGPERGLSRYDLQRL